MVMSQMSTPVMEALTLGYSEAVVVCALARKVTTYFWPAVKPEIVALSAPPDWMNATFVPAGMKPLSAYRLEPPAGFRPARLGSVAVHPVMAVLSVMVPEAV